MREGCMDDEARRQGRCATTQDPLVRTPRIGNLVTLVPAEYEPPAEETAGGTASWRQGPTPRSGATRVCSPRLRLWCGPAPTDSRCRWMPLRWCAETRTWQRVSTAPTLTLGPRHARGRGESAARERSQPLAFGEGRRLGRYGRRAESCRAALCSSLPRPRGRGVVNRCNAVSKTPAPWRTEPWCPWT
jgi:hypothetical protein